MKKGKPGIGYHAARRITAAERRASGMPARTVIMHEHGTGNITFWENGNGGLDRLRPVDGAESALDRFWADTRTAPVVPGTQRSAPLRGRQSRFCAELDIRVAADASDNTLAVALTRKPKKRSKQTELAG